ncbi:MAG: hypothetical protein Q8O11_10800, partial [Syntrophales bacterium]|nr:hypothetical protein [Syntrophales bacterium]
GGTGQSTGRTSPAFLEEVVRSVGAIFSGSLVPVIPLLQNPFETLGRNLRTRDGPKPSAEKRGYLTTVIFNCQ